MFIGDLRRRLFIPIDHEWNGVVRDFTAKYEQPGGEGEVSAEPVCAAIAEFYKNRATLATLRGALPDKKEIEEHRD
jgi:hypothetical protein